VGSINHMSMEVLKSAAKIDVVHIPHKGMAPALTDLMAGNVQILIVSLPSVTAQMKSGRLRALGVTTLKRSGYLPDAPTISGAAVPGYDYSHLVRDMAAVAHAASDRQPSLWRNRKARSFRGAEGRVRLAERRTHAHAARAIRRVLPGGNREVGQGDTCDGGEAGMIGNPVTAAGIASLRRCLL
jgi:hypothetical protein